LPVTSESADDFLTELAHFGADGLADVAPGEDIGAAADTGNVIGYEATLGDFPGTGTAYSYQQGVAGIPGANETGDRFGAAIVGRLQNAITVGAPGENVGSIVDAGAVTDIGVPSLGPIAATSWRQGGDGIAGTPERGDQFGASLTAATYGHVVIGAPGEDVGSVVDAGVIQLIPVALGTPVLTATGNVALHQNSPGVTGTAEAGDRFGAALGQGVNTALVGLPGEDVGSVNAAGAVVVLQTDGSTGMFDAGLASQQVTQDSNGVDGIAEPSDRFGGSASGSRSDT
jgi:hypothetical protein